MKKKKKRDGYILRVRLSDEDNKQLKEGCKTRGLDQSNYVRELIRGTNKGSFFSVDVKEGLEDISSGICFFSRRKLSDEEDYVLKRMEKGVNAIWHCSR